MTAFDRKYSDAQYEAIWDAHFARGLRYDRIAQLAADGQLTKDEPFEIQARYVGDLCRAEKKRRAGKNRSKLAELGHTESNDAMRAALLNLWDSERIIVERQKPGDRDLARIEHMAKVALAITRLPAAKDTRPRNPATRDENGERGERLAGGPGGLLLAAHRASQQSQTDDEYGDDDGTAGSTAKPKPAGGAQSGGSGSRQGESAAPPLAA